MKKVLIVSYSQTGQLHSILESLAAPLIRAGLQVEHLVIEPEVAYPFPWGRVTFFNEFPESVFNIPTRLKPISTRESKYDLIILGYTVWYLNPSIPISSFLQSRQATEIMNDTPVLTVIGARNMWVLAQQKVRDMVAQCGGRMVGNIALVDRNPNLVSIITVIRWMFWGKRDATALLPKGGILEEDVRDAARFGPAVVEALNGDDLTGLNEKLLALGSATISPSLLILEQRATRLFGMYGRFIIAKGGHDEPARLGRVNLLSVLLPIGAFVLSPITTLSTALVSVLRNRSLQAECKALLRY